MDDLYSLMDSEVQVLSEAFDLLEQLGVKGLEKPPKSLRRDDKKETIELRERRRPVTLEPVHNLHL